MCWAGRSVPVENWWQWGGYAALNVFLLCWAASMRAANIRDVPPLTKTSSHVCALPWWILEGSTKLHQGHPSKPHTLLHHSFILLCMKILLQGKPASSKLLCIYFFSVSQETCRTCRLFKQLMQHVEWCTQVGWWDKNLPPNLRVFFLVWGLVLQSLGE